jgi:CBS domain containing-hemolysin-like protein
LSGASRARLGRDRGLIGRAVHTLLADPRMLLITLMFGNMLANVSYFVVSSVLLLKLNAAHTNPLIITIATFTPLLVIIVFGEVLPKLLANTAQITWVRATAIPMLAVHRFINPLRLVLNQWLISPLSRLIEPRSRPAALSPDELEALIQLSQQRGVIDRSEEQLLREVVALSQMRVRQVMIPRVDIHWIDQSESPQALRRLIERTGLTKFLVCRGDLDHVEGIVYARQFLLAAAAAREREQPLTLRSITRNVQFVPEQQRVDQLITDFRRRGMQLAVVVDEYGGTAGLVTLKDVLERLVGDLDMDEAPGEGEAIPARSLGDGRWQVNGRLAVRDWAEAFGQRRVPEEVVTVGGLITAKLGRIPHVGDTVSLGNLRLEVQSMDRGRVESVLLELDDPSRTPATTGGPS